MNVTTLSLYLSIQALHKLFPWRKPSPTSKYKLHRRTLHRVKFIFTSKLNLDTLEALKMNIMCI